MNLWLIIPAAGEGIRMQGAVPKQFVPLLGKPVIIHVLEKFKKLFPQIQIIISTQKQYFEWFENQKKQWPVLQNIMLTEGGRTRFESVKTALDLITDDGFVAVHDAVRPMVSEKLIQKLFQLAFHKGNAVPATELKESIRKWENNRFVNTDRTLYRVVQTPQIFKVNELKQAYLQAANTNFTDDASVMESAGYTIFLETGEETNIKLTYPIDIQLAELLLGLSD